VVEDITTQALRSEDDFSGTYDILKAQLKAWNNTYQVYADNLEERLDRFKNLNYDAKAWSFDISDMLLIRQALRYVNILLHRLYRGVPLDDSFFTAPELANCGITYGKVYGDVSFKKFGWFSPIEDVTEGRLVSLVCANGTMNENKVSEYVYTYTTEEKMDEETGDTWMSWVGFVPGRVDLVTPFPPIHDSEGHVIPPGEIKSGTVQMVRFGNYGSGYCTGILGDPVDNIYPQRYQDEERRNATPVTYENASLLYLASEMKAGGKDPAFFYYDPDYDWFDTVTRLKVVQRYLKMTKFFKGWFGTGKHGMTEVIDDLTKYRTLREAKWIGQQPKKYAEDAIFGIRRFSVDLPVDIDSLMDTVYGTRDPKALFQIGNVWAIRHALVRALVTQLYRFAAKAM
jgi:hypothetical protein